MSLVHRSLMFSAFQRYGTLVIYLISTAVLARLLTPEEFGIYAIVSGLTTITAASFQEFGGANYLIQKRDLNEQDVRTAFTVTIILSLLLGALFYASRDVLAVTFSKQALAAGIAVSALSFVITPFSGTISALLQRDMDFGKWAFCNLCGSIAAAAASILFALLHYSFMAPIWGMIGGQAVTAILLVASKGNLRIFRPSLVGYRDVVRFGLYSSGVVIINVFYNLAPQLFLARNLGFTSVGLYGRATGITQVFDKAITQVLNPVVLPAILSHSKSGGDLKRIYLNAIELITAVQWPFLTFIAIMAQPLILIWLGPTWAETIPLVRILCIAYLSMFAAWLTYPTLVAVGQVRDALLASLISLPPSLLLMFIASFFGVHAVAASSLIALPFQVCVAFYLVARHLAITPAHLFRATLKSAVVTISSNAGPLMCAGLVGMGLLGYLPGLLTGAVFAGAGWLIGMMATRHPLLEKLDVLTRVSGWSLALPSIFARPGRTQPGKVLR